MRISDWSSDVCSSDLLNPGNRGGNLDGNGATAPTVTAKGGAVALTDTAIRRAKPEDKPQKLRDGGGLYLLMRPDGARWWRMDYRRPVTESEEHTSELQSLMRISYAVFCLKKKTK